MEQSYEMRQLWTVDQTNRQPQQQHPSAEKYYNTSDQDWDGGLDNDGLDLSQLDHFINDANNDAMYFGELGTVDEIKNLTSAHTRDSPSRQPHQHHIHHTNINQRHWVDRSRDSTVGIPIRYRRHHVDGYIYGYYYCSQHPHSNHHLPDSPPDSGSEPPYSPDHPNLSPNQRSQLNDLYSPTHSNGSSLINMGGFAAMPNQPPQKSHVHSVAVPPQPNLHHQPITSSLGVNNGLAYPNGAQVNMGASQPQSIPMQNPYAQMVSNGGGGSRTTADNLVGQSSCKKRKTSDVSGPHSHGVNIKQEPGNLGHSKHSNAPLVAPVPHGIPDGALHMHGTMTFPGEDEEYSVDGNSNAFMDPSYQCIRFQTFQQPNWSRICDSSLKELNLVTFRVDADKGFNFSHPDDAFVCQKKNHFQVTNHIQVSGEPYYVKTPEGLQKVDRFYVHFFGVKTESPSQTIRVEQSQSDRSKKAFHPVPIEMKPDQVTKVTVGRLHFSETTSNNMRKKGKPNPDQRYFYLVVSLQAHCGDNSYPVAAHASEKLIVRASNPGQFESDVEYTFQRGTYPESIFHMGRVGINTDRPEEALVIHGNLRITGQLFQPSDLRAKEKIQEVDTKEQLKNVQSLRVVKYAYKDNFVKQAGLQGDEIYDTGIIAQELKEVIPDAVRTTGDFTLADGGKITNFLMVNKERIFMENVGAVKELCKVTGNLENRIGELERMNSKITKIKRIDSFKSTTSSSTRASSVVSQISSVSRSGERHRKHYGRNDPTKFCTNKLLQISTITVVCIMALCLMAFATIYIIDIQERRHSRKTSSFTSTTNGLNYTIITGSRNPTTSFPFNVSSSQLLSSMSFFPTSFKTYSPPTATTTTTDDNSLTSVTFTIITTPMQYQPVLPPVLGKPQHCFTQLNDCQVRCCSVPTDRALIPRRTSRPSSITVTRRFTLEGRGSETPLPSYESDLITNRLSTNDPYVPNLSSTEDQIPVFKNPPVKKSDSLYRRRFHRLNDKTNSAEGINVNLKNSKLIVKKRSVQNSEVENPVKKIEIVELGATINHIYCLNFSQEYYMECTNGSANNFTYGIPLSKFMQYDNLTLSFEFYRRDGARRLFFCSNCSGCQSDLADNCENGSSPSTNQRTSEAIVTNNHIHQTILIDIGKMKRVTYKFRIRISAIDFTNPCQYESSLAGESFYEYNLFFYRSCDT